MNNQNLTWEQAYMKMLTGEKVTHRYFSDDEFIFMKPDDFCIYSEDGVNHGEDFLKHRQDAVWENDWGIFVS